MTTTALVPDALSVDLDDIGFEQSGPFRATSTGLSIVSEPTWKEWQGLIAWLQAAHQSLAFWIGDALNIGEAQFGEQYAQAVADLGWAAETVRVYQWVCERVPASRRITGLTFGHHQVVASLDPDEQTRWLRAAADSQDGPLSTRGLKSAILRASRPQAAVWVMVPTDSMADAERLCTRLQADGYAAKVVTHG